MLHGSQHVTVHFTLEKPMAVIANKRSVMILYSEPDDIYCHRVRMVLAEKGVNVEIVDVNMDDKPEDLAQLNPYNSVPTLVDRDLVIYESRIIMEYLDERFPHPPLMPVYPVARAKNRQIMHRIDKEMYSQLHRIYDAVDDNERDTARSRLKEMMMGLEPLFAQNDFFLSDEYSMVDCCLSALIWRLPSLLVDIPESCKNFHQYCARVFERGPFKEGMSDAERDLR